MYIFVYTSIYVHHTIAYQCRESYSGPVHCVDRVANHSSNEEVKSVYKSVGCECVSLVVIKKLLKKIN